VDLSQIGVTAGYGFAHFGIKGGYDDYLWCFRRLAELGFRNFNMEILEEDQVDLFTPERVSAFRDLAKSLNIHIPIFTAYFVENDLVSLSPERRQKGLRNFRFSIDVAARLGAAVMNIASEFPPELVSAYRPEYVHSPAAAFRVPREVSWSSIWDTHVEVVRECADLCAERGMKFTLEPRANCLIATTDSFLRLADHVDRSNLGCSLDLMHCAFQREDISTAVKKLGSLLMEVQVCDADGQTLSHLPIGRGNIDFPDVMEALSDIRFAGILALEIYGITDVDEAYAASRAALEELIGRARPASGTT
jgi:sugar phosphate isomerase/epimerase